MVILPLPLNQEGQFSAVKVYAQSTGQPHKGLKRYRKSLSSSTGVWLGEAKVSCSFCHQGAQLILAYSWARLAVLAAG